MVTMRDVAARAGVTKQTVSNVLSGRVPVRPETAKRVRAAVDDLGYRPNLVARSLATGSTKSVGLFVPEVGSRFYADIIEEVEDVLEDNGYHLLLSTTRLDGSRTRRHLHALSSRAVDALIVAEDRGVVNELDAMAAMPFPIILCAWEGAVPGSLPVVTIDYDNAGHLAGEHLRELGHERVAVLARETHAGRVAGFTRAFAESGITLPESAITMVPVRSSHDGFEETLTALRQDDSITAVFATHDTLTLGAMAAAQVSGRSVPDDLSIIGVDDLADDSDARPAITTVTFPQREMARQAASTLLASLETHTAPINSAQLLRPELVVRASTAAPAAG